MNNQISKLPPHYSYIPGDVLQFVEASNRPVVVFGRLNQTAAILQLAAEGMDIYKQTVRGCAPKYDMLTCKREKTSYTSGIVLNFMSKEFLFIEKDGDNYFEYNMETIEAFNKVREKVRQAMMDFLRKKKRNSVLSIPEISILKFEGEGPLLSSEDMKRVFDILFEPEIEQVLDNISFSSDKDEEEEGGAYDLEEGQDEEMDDLSFSDFSMTD